MRPRTGLAPEWSSNLVVRYKDISPYDSTRVILTDCPSGDFINANHVVMEIPGSGIVNRSLFILLY